MLRLLTPLEQNTSWVPRESNFMTSEQTQKLFETTKSCDAPVSFNREELPPDYFDKKVITPPPPPDSITITEAINELTL